MVLSFVGCGSKETTETTTEATTEVATEATAEATTEATTETATEEVLTVGVVLKTLSSEYWGYVAAGVMDAEEEFGCKVVLQGPPSETSYNEQINMIETMISSGEVDALAIAPLQADMVVTQLKDATIPVLFVDTDAPYDKSVSFIGTGNEEAAYKGGQYMAAKLTTDSKVVIIAGVAGNPTIEARVNGYKKAMEEAGIEVLDTQYAESNAEKSVNIMENFMQSYERIDAVLCVGDSMAMAAQRAAAQVGRDDIMFMGFDGISSGVEAVISGSLTATVAQSPYNMGYEAVKTALAAAKGETVESRIDTGIQVIDSENAQAYLDELNAMAAVAK
jgi:ribose transport system substrate-binding protein